MADIIYADPETEDILLTEEGDIAGGEETDCDCCGDCDCETEGPTVSFRVEQISTEEDGCCFQFEDTSTSSSKCGEIVEWDWDYGDGSPHGSIRTPTHCFTGTGPFLVTLKITDASGCEKTTQTEFSCCDCGSNGPQADFSYIQTSHSPCCIEFFDESIAGSCGEIVEWEWNFGDGTTGTGPNPTHCYPSPGPWNVTLTVTDAKGCTDSGVGPVKCVGQCNCCNNYPPLTATVVISGFADPPDHDCPACADVNGTYEVILQEPFDNCEYRAQKSVGSLCDLNGAPDDGVIIRVKLLLDAFGGWQVEVSMQQFLLVIHYFTKSFPCPTNCSGTHILTSIDATYCNVGSVTVTL